MTNEEFYSELKKATTVEEVAKLRKICGATRFISACKEKIADVALKEGFNQMEVSLSCLKSLTNFTDCGQFFTFNVPTKNRKFSAYKRVYGYVNSKEGCQSQTLNILVKENTTTKSLEQRILEEYFNAPVEKVKNEEYYIEGHWYQVRPTSILDTESEESDLNWIKNCPVQLYEKKLYYIIEQ